MHFSAAAALQNCALAPSLTAIIAIKQLNLISVRCFEKKKFVACAFGTSSVGGGKEVK